MPQKQSPEKSSDQTTTGSGGTASGSNNRDYLQDAIGNQAIQQIMAEEMTPEQCERYEVWVPEIERCLASGAAPNSQVGNALIGLVGTKLVSMATGGAILGLPSTVGQAVSRVAAAQVGGSFASMLQQLEAGASTDVVEEAPEKAAPVTDEP